MSSTRSPSFPEPDTELLLVSHGSPSEPEPQEDFIRALAGKVADWTDRTVRGATLAKKGALEAACAGLARPQVFPHFMADGWFVSTNLPKRLAASGLTDWTMLPSLGLQPELGEVAIRRLSAELERLGVAEADATVVVAAHGSPSDRRPAQATERFAGALQATNRFGNVRVGYVDEKPSIEEAARTAMPAIVLPFFAARAGHVLMDLPEALEAARYDGPVLDPIGTWDEIPALIAAAARETVTAA